MVEDYRTVQLSLRAHPLAFLRAELDRRGIMSAAPLSPGSRTAARSKSPESSSSASGPAAGNVTFLTIEDETGIANVIVWQRLFEAQRRIIMSAAMIGVKGTRPARRRR